MTTRVAFATAAEHAALYDDDRLAVACLRARGVEVLPLVWDASDELPTCDALVVRSCWDYHRKPAAFLAWIARLADAGVTLWNPAHLLRWNLDKRYLRDLAARGATIPRSLWLDAGARVDLRALLAAHDLSEAVVKPTVSLNGEDTWRTNPADAPAHQARLDALLHTRGVLVQEYVPEITTGGEMSFVFFGGRCHHAVRKRARAGEFRVQEQYGGSREALDPPAGLVAQAQAIVAGVGEALLYARVDGVEVEGRLVLMEFEIIDPFLYLAHAAGAPERFAEVVQGAAAGRSPATSALR